MNTTHPETYLLTALAMSGDLLEIYRSRDRELIDYVENNAIDNEMCRAIIYLADPEEELRLEGRKIIDSLMTDQNVFRRIA